MIVEDGKYFLYRHIRLDKNEPFYIGIGTKRNCYTGIGQEYHRAGLKVKRNIIWNHIKNKTNYKVEIILESNDYDFIKRKEQEFIRLYGRKDTKSGILANRSGGGEGNPNFIPSELARNKSRERMIKMNKELKRDK